MQKKKKSVVRQNIMINHKPRKKNKWFFEYNLIFFFAFFLVAYDTILKIWVSRKQKLFYNSFITSVDNIIMYQSQHNNTEIRFTNWKFHVSELELVKVLHSSKYCVWFTQSGYWLSQYIILYLKGQTIHPAC